MNESDIRQAILSELRQEYRSDQETLIIEELGLCQGDARIDIAVVNGSIHGYEIKSDQDTLKRLKNQIEIYNRSLFFVTLVVGERHLIAALKLIPKWWGVIIAKEISDQKPLLRIRRKEKSNPCLDPFAVAQLLWRDEALTALKQQGLHKGFANKPRAVLWRRLVEHLPAEELPSLVRSFFKERENWRSGYKQA